MRCLLALAVAVAIVASGCARPGAGQPSAALSGRTEDGGVTVVAVLTLGPDGTGNVRATFMPLKPGFHLYSIDLPRAGVNGLGIPTDFVQIPAAGTPLVRPWYVLLPRGVPTRPAVQGFCDFLRSARAPEIINASL